jgi:hypothetical protein
MWVPVKERAPVHVPLFLAGRVEALEDVGVEVDAEGVATSVGAMDRTGAALLRARSAQARRQAEMLEDARDGQLTLDVSGLVGGGLGATLAGRGFGALSTHFVSNTAASMAGNATGQFIGMATGAQSQFHFDELGMAGLTGALSGLTASALTRGMTHTGGDESR